MAPLSPAPVPRVLSIAGTDPSGGAGTAADLKSIVAADGYAMSVVTALVAQNTHGVRDIHVPPTEFLAAQLDAVGDDVEVDAVKTGMLGSADIIETVSTWLDSNPPRVLVVDPVMIASSGDRLLDEDAEHAMIDFCRRATVVTPNIDELAVLTGCAPATEEAAALPQARQWAADTGVAVLVKTGHLDSREVANTWVRPDGSTIVIPSTRVDTSSTHGTGCSLASALATRLGRGDSPAAALEWATAWLHEAIAHGEALGVGSGHGPVDHAHRSRRLEAAGSTAPWLAADTVAPALETPGDLTPPSCDLASSSADAGDSGGSPTAGPVAAAVEPVESAVAPAGPWTAALWAASTGIARAIAESDVVRALVDGSLSETAFAFYLSQDALYLGRYSRALAALSARASDPEAQAFWAGGAASCLTVEPELHRSWWGARATTDPRPPMSPVTSAYTDFLVATALSEDHAVGAAAVLPCYWLYAQTAATLPEVPAGHPYADWLGTYRDPAFVTATRGALTQVERELAAASPTVRAAAARAYLTACRHELEFFGQALRVAAP